MIPFRGFGLDQDEHMRVMAILHERAEHGSDAQT